MTQGEAVITFCGRLRDSGYVVRGLTTDGVDVVIEFRKPEGHWSGFLHITPGGEVVEGNGKPGPGAYYTPGEIMDPAAGTGGFLSNPPYGKEDNDGTV